ncbi:MAG: glutamate--tRNA ligase [Imperialibacter sp.]|uniref:glutamate--tRNA ligase n=1 Tax=Imperialibacter sp. TaxID=2038411 RepID=UPI0032EFD343
MNNSEVRVRFAPSPTGALHIGGVRTALYNYLFARKNNGTMLLRIEDTDQSRFVPGAEAYILESLKWVGIEIDEGPLTGGPHAPYKQSERKDIYAQYAQQLIDQGKAYYAFDTSEELDAMREKLKAAKVANQQYNAVTRNTMQNSLTLPEAEVKARLANGDPYVVRLMVPRKEDIRFHDLIRGWVVVHSSVLDDKILLKSDGMPTYHLANIVDDHLMKITHVIRGEEWLPSAPLHVLMYRYFGWEDTMPQFAHLPLLLKPDGNGKLSKRDADKAGFPIFPLNWADPVSGELSQGFREKGYLPETMINFLALLGWSPGTEKEIFSMEELIQEFSIERISKAGAKFDIDKANWFNQHYIKNKSAEELAVYLQKDLDKEGVKASPAKVIKVAEVLRERISFPHELWEQNKFFFEVPTAYDQQVVEKKWNSDVAAVLHDLSKRISQLEDSVTATTAHDTIENFFATKELKMGKYMQPLRLSITGQGGGPDLMAIIEILGAKETAKRIDSAIVILGGQSTQA